MGPSVILDSNKPVPRGLVHYRLYFLGHDGRIIRGLDLECEDDATAIATARRQDHGYATELWQSARRIGSFDPKR